MIGREIEFDVRPVFRRMFTPRLSKFRPQYGSLTLVAVREIEGLDVNYGTEAVVLLFKIASVFRDSKSGFLRCIFPITEPLLDSRITRIVQGVQGNSILEKLQSLVDSKFTGRLIKGWKVEDLGNFDEYSPIDVFNETLEDISIPIISIAEEWHLDLDTLSRI